MTQVVVVIPAYNVGSWVRDAVASVLGQTHRDLRVVVVDDGSTDESMRFLDGIDDPRLVVVQQANAGLSNARNRGWEELEGDVFAFLDADDVWYPTKVERSLPLLDVFAAVGSRMQYLGEDGTPLRASAGFSPEATDVLAAITRAEVMPFPISSMLFRADAVRAAGLFDPALPQSEDLDFVARVARFGAIGWIGEPLGGYRLRATSMSAARQDEQKLIWRFVVARTAARAAGGELDLEAFRRTYRPSRRTRWRDRSAALYREGGLRIANRTWSGAGLMALAALRSPAYALPRLVRQAR